MKELILSPSVRCEAARWDTPFLLLDPEIVAANYRAVAAALPAATIYYAVKANPSPVVVERLMAEGSGFEVASFGEMELALSLGVRPDRMISSNPVKRPDFLRQAARRGLDLFAVDSDAELEKLARHAPGSRVYCRVQVDNSGSDWPLSRKFGLPQAEVVGTLLRAASLGLRPYGLTFHVGSQCLNPLSWSAAIATCGEICREAARKGLWLRMLNLGGGLPVQHLKPTPSPSAICHTIAQLVAEHFPPDVELVLEPGRALVGSAAILTTSVIGKARRGDQHWLYLDAGVFNGLMETIAGFGYQLATDRGGPTRRFTVAGPSCDSVDVMFTDVELPDLEVGDRVYVLNAGAYTLSYASRFNGFEPPEVRLIASDGSADPTPLAVAARA